MHYWKEQENKQKTQNKIKSITKQKKTETPKNPKQPLDVYETYFKLVDIPNTYLHTTNTVLKLLFFSKYSVEILNVFTVFQVNGLISFLLLLLLGFFVIIFASVAL